MNEERHIFSSVLACLSGLRGGDRERVRDLILRAGGAVSSNLTANCTHLITSELRGNKCRKAMDMSNIKIVPQQWVFRSVLNNKLESEENYDARRPLVSLTQSPVLDPLHCYGKQVLSPFQTSSPSCIFVAGI